MGSQEPPVSVESGEPCGEPDLQAHRAAIRGCSPLPMGAVSGEDPRRHLAAGKPSPLESVEATWEQ